MIYKEANEILIFRVVSNNKGEKGDDTVVIDKYDFSGKYIDSFNIYEALENGGDKVIDTRLLSCFELEKGYYFLSLYSNNGYSFITFKWGEIENVTSLTFDDLPKFDNQKKANMLIPHNPISIDNGFLFFCESKRDSTKISRDDKGNYIYEHICFSYTAWLVFRFDKNGVIQWFDTEEMDVKYDPYLRLMNSVPMKRFVKVVDNVKQKEFTIYVPSHSGIEVITFAYGYGKMYSDFIESKEFTPFLVGDKIKEKEIEYEPWYDDYYIAYGKMTVKRDKKKRDFFRIEKVSIE